MKLTRREFLRTASLTAGAMSTSSTLLGSTLEALSGDVTESPPGGKSRVVIGRCASLFDNVRRVDRKSANELVTRSIQALTDQKDSRESWRSLFAPKDVVGIKVNCIGKRALSSQVEIVESVVEGLSSIGVKRIIVWDRLDEELEAAGFTLRTSGGPYACFGTNHRGVGFSRRLLIQGEIGSLFSRILTEYCTAIINVPVMKDHDLAGVTGAMKNNFGVIHNPNKYHFDPLHRALADLNTMDHIRGKTRLIVCDASRIIYNGGPAFKPQWTDWFGGVVMSRDPVATDAVSWRMIEQRRRTRGLPTLTEAERKPEYIELASKPPYRLGNSNESDIERVELEL